MAIQADATLVAAAYRMGMANVPRDTSTIFQQQYQALAGVQTARLKMFGDITKAVGGALTEGVKTLGKVAVAKRDEEWWEGAYDIEDKIEKLSQPDGKSWNDHFNKKNGGPPWIMLEIIL